MKLTLAANYDEELIPKLQPYPVVEVYGKFPSDLAGGGRPSYMGTPLSRKDLARYISSLSHQGIGFNYLLNASCMGNREWSRSWQKKLVALLNTLGELGVQALTVSTPYLLELIKKRFPAFKVKVGIYAQVDTPSRAVFWENLGADAINLESFSINRNIPLLAAIRKAVSCDLQLIANHVCLPNCAMQPYHQNAFAHSSDGSRNLFIDYCFLRCTRHRLEDPSFFIKAQWIRPEDVAFYEGLGFETFKLIERGIPSEELLRRVKAYTERRYEGNLADILLSYGFRKAPRKGRFWILRNFIKPFQINPVRLKKLYDLAHRQGMLFAQQVQPIHIEASQIPTDFIDSFRSRVCATMNCDDCRYCEQIAARSGRIDPEFRDEVLQHHYELENALVGGNFWQL